MKKISALLLIFGLVFQINAQNKINRYEYWYDQNYTDKSMVAISATNQYTLNTSLATTGLSGGIHTFNIRFRDDSLKWSTTVSQFFYKNGGGADTARKISTYQYWIDQDFQNSKTLAVSPNAVNFNLNGLLDMSTLNYGIHVLNVRFMDHSGFWSTVVTQFFYKTEMKGFVGSDSIVEVEYWADQDYNTKTKFAAGPKNQILFMSDLNVSSLSIGLHTLNIRFKDGKGLWSSVMSPFFYKTELPGITGNDSITNAEYWVDGDYIGKISESLTPKNQWIFLKDLDLKKVSEGLHTISIRFKDGKGLWSSVVNQFFYKTKPGIAGENLINAYRYWIDDADTAIQKVILNTPVNPYELALNLDMKKIWKGIHRVHFQFRDTAGNWSVVLTDTFVKKALPVALFTVSATKFCDSGAVQFENQSIDFDSLIWDFGDGNISHQVNPVHQYKVAGKYAVKLWIADTVSMLTDQYSMKDSIEISATPVYSLGKDTAVCDNANFVLQAPVKIGLTYKWQDRSNKQTFKPVNSGTFYCEVKTSLGCHWTDSINVQIKPLALAGFTFVINKTQVDFTDASANAADLVWKFGDNVTSIQNNPSHSYPALGVYTAWQLAKNSCNTDSISKTIQIVQTIVPHPTNIQNWVVYPNPTSDWCNIDLPETAGPLKIQVFAADGRLIENIHWIQNSTALEVDLSNVSDGVYRLEILDSDLRHHITVLKQRN